MKRRFSTDRKPLKAGRRKAKAAKPPYAPKAARFHKCPAAREETEVARLRRELSEVLEQQTATSEILKVISSSPGDLKPVFEAMLDNASRICEADAGNLFLCEPAGLRAVAVRGEPQYVETWRGGPLVALADGEDLPINRIARTKSIVHIADLRTEPAYIQRHPRALALVDAAGARTLLNVPLLRDNELVGVFGIFRRQVRPFTDKQIELVQNFAAQAAIAIENTRLLNELRESLQQQTATSEVLKVISASPGELKSVFGAMLENAVRFCEAKFAQLFLYDRNANHFRAVGTLDLPLAWAEYLGENPVPASPLAPLGRAATTKQPVHIEDVRKDEAYIEGFPPLVKLAELGGARTLLVMPMLKEKTLVGAIGIYRQEVRPFAEKQIELVQNFAAQAVIAIENTRLLNELRQRTDDLSESLQQQTATSEVLGVISSSPGELEPVFNTMLANATRICGAGFGTLNLYDGDVFRNVALHNVPDEYARIRLGEVFRPHPQSGLAAVIRTKQPKQIEDIRRSPGYLAGNPTITAIADIGKARTIMLVPMLKDDQFIGVIGIYRQEVLPFTPKQIELLQNFAAQAVIAIENTRLLSELRESLQQQTATADVLKVISRSTFDLQTVLDTLVKSAAHLCDADIVNIWRPSGSAYRLAAVYQTVPSEHREYLENVSIGPNRGSCVGRTLLNQDIVHIDDILSDPEYSMEVSKLGGYRTMLGVPLLREGTLIGVIALVRSVRRPFTEKQIELVKTFADQAVIAIENVRLFEAEQQRTQELSESLQRQTATADVLKVISRSAFDLQVVLDTLVQSAARLCDADMAAITRLQGSTYRHVASYGLTPEEHEGAKRVPIEVNRSTVTGRAVLERNIVRILDAKSDPDFHFAAGLSKIGFRTLLGVPLLREGLPIGVIVLMRKTVSAFTDKQIELLTTFADQAAIAIENVRLFDEVQARTRDLAESLQQQTATADVLKAISRSAFDLKTVLDALVEAAARLCEADQGTIARERDGVYLRVATYGFPDDFTEYVKNLPVVPERGTAVGRALLEGKVVHIPDVQADPEYTFVEAQKLGGFRTVLAVPMLREGTPIGVLSLTRHEVRPFTDKQIELVTTFADQAAIAIENVRLFESVEARTRELAKSLEDLRTAQDRLVQTEKLASLGQLTAGIAHEIKNPLNFVNNFSAISVELIDELREALAGANLDDKLRGEISEIADMLQGNLDKVVQHGKRADSIVKNMLLHSRQGSREHRPVDINAIVEESLNLAYHGARAEKQGFNITLERSLDPTAGEVDLFPQEITRVLLNLISNGFYAATKRKAEANGGNYEPTLAAATKNLGDSVEIRIRDNGTGIPPEVKEKMFNPFFTTKPVGEGTGLGLSISHDIIVKQHGGSIEVDTQPGEFTEVQDRSAAWGCNHRQIRRTRVNLLILVVDDEPDVEAAVPPAVPA